jgi:hypothetical protein
MIPTAGVWDPNAGPIAFSAIVHDQGRSHAPSYPTWPILWSAIAFKSNADRERLAVVMRSGSRVMLDSGVYSLAASYATQEGIPLEKALEAQPESIDGYEAHLENYIALCKEFGDSVWGYVELDFGGHATKRRTRELLQGRGLRPIPVYHPLSDPPSYFDELLEESDRICVGNLVRSRPSLCARILRTVVHRRGDRSVWLHALGMGHMNLVFGNGFNSLDASSWALGVLAYGGQHAVSAGAENFSRLDGGFTLARGTEKDDPAGRLNHVHLAVQQMIASNTNCRDIYQGQR